MHLPSIQLAPVSHLSLHLPAWQTGVLGSGFLLPGFFTQSSPSHSWGEQSLHGYLAIILQFFPWFVHVQGLHLSVVHSGSFLQFFPSHSNLWQSILLQSGIINQSIMYQQTYPSQKLQLPLVQTGGNTFGL